MRKNQYRILSPSDQMTEFLLYSVPIGQVKIEVVLNNETLWLTQQRIAELFGVGVPAISKHLKNIFEAGELEEEEVVSILENTTPHGAIVGKTQTQLVKYYNLDAIISVGYRVNSTKATQFRIWATRLLKEYIIKGFTMDDERLKNGRYFGKDYFHELLERVRSIRASERRVYQQITDIFAECSIDYDPKSETTKLFYAHVQDKFHYAITGQTAAEKIYHTADSSKPLMGMLSFKQSPSGRVLKSDTTVGKNYLTEDELRRLERAISAYFDYIENIIERRNTFTMESFAASVNKFLEFNEYKILEGYGCVSRKQAEAKALAEYEKFKKQQVIESDFDRLLKKNGKLEQVERVGEWRIPFSPSPAPTGHPLPQAGEGKGNGEGVGVGEMDLLGEMDPLGQMDSLLRVEGGMVVEEVLSGKVSTEEVLAGKVSDGKEVLIPSPACGRGCPAGAGEGK